MIIEHWITVNYEVSGRKISTRGSTSGEVRKYFG